MEELEQVNIVETLAHAKKVLNVHREWVKNKKGHVSPAVDMVDEIEASFETLPSSITLPRATSTPLGRGTRGKGNGEWNREIEEEMALDQPKEKRSMLMDDSASSSNNFPSTGRKRKQRRSKATIVPVTTSPTSSSTSLKLDPSSIVSNAWERDSETESQQPFEPNVIKRELRLHETLAHIQGNGDIEEGAMASASKQPLKHRLSAVRSATIVNVQESSNTLSSKQQGSLHSKSGPQLDRKKSLLSSTTSITPTSSSITDISTLPSSRRSSTTMPTLSEPLVVKPASIKRKLSRNNKVQPIHVVEPVKPVLPVNKVDRLVWQQPVNGDLILEDAEDWIPPEDTVQLKPNKETSSVGSKGEEANGDMKVSDVVGGVHVVQKSVKMVSSDSITISDVGGVVPGKQDHHGNSSIYSQSPFSPKSNRNGNFKITDEHVDIVPLSIPPLEQSTSRKASLPIPSLTSTVSREDGDNGDTSSDKGDDGDNGDGNTSSVKGSETLLSSKVAGSFPDMGIKKPQPRQLLPPLVKGNKREDEQQEDISTESSGGVEEERWKGNESNNGKDEGEETEVPQKPPPLRVKSSSSIYTPDFKFQKKRDRAPPVYLIHALSSTLPPACPLYSTKQPTPDEVLDRTVLSRTVLPSTQPSSASSQSKTTPTSVVNEDNVSRNTVNSNESIDYSRHFIATPTGITGPSELHLAARDGNIRKVQMLLNEGYKVDELDDENRTPLMYCILPNGNAQLHCVDLLLRKGANIDHQSSEGFTALHLASYCGIVSLMELLILNGANPDIKDVDERLPLHWSTHPVSTKPIELLLKHSVNDVNVVDKSDMTLLMWACYNCNVTMAKYLLDRGADPEEKDTEGKTAMHWACSQGDIHCLQLLLTPDMTYFKDQTGCTVMHTAAQHGFILGVQYILKKRLEAVYDADKEGRTPLHYAAASDRVDVCYLLLNKGADATHKDNHSLTALEYAKKTCNEYVVALFTCHRASMADFTRRERTLRNESRRSTTKSHDMFDDVESNITQESLRSHDYDNISIATTISSSRFQDDMECIKEASVGGYLGLFSYQDYNNVTEKELRDPPCHYYFWLDNNMLCWSRSKDKPKSRNTSGCSRVSRVEEGPSILVKSRPDYSPQDLHQFAFRVWLEGGQPLDLLAYTSDYHYMWIVGLNALLAQDHSDDDTPTVSVFTDETEYNQTTGQHGCHDVQEENGVSHETEHKTSFGQKKGLELM